MPWSAPEVLANSAEGGVVATTATDVYQLGGTLIKNFQLLHERRCSAGGVVIPGTTFSVPGLLGKSTLQAAVIDSQPVTWRVNVDGIGGSGGRLGELVGIVEGCLEEDPAKRWKGSALYVLAVLRVFADRLNVRICVSLRCLPLELGS
jgi:hypothetical protein